jgi:hypothetical protein
MIKHRMMNDTAKRDSMVLMMMKGYITDLLKDLDGEP